MYKLNIFELWFIILSESNSLLLSKDFKSSNLFVNSSVPEIFLICSIGSGLEKIIEKNLEPPKILDLIVSPEIYIPFIIFICLVLITFVLKKLFYR